MAAGGPRQTRDKGINIDSYIIYKKIIQKACLQYIKFLLTGWGGGNEGGK
jgi:hypothetical protein